MGRRNGGVGWIWKRDTGFSELGVLSLKGHTGSAATGASADGSVVVGGSSGVSHGPRVYHSEAIRWTAESGLEQIGVLPGRNASWFGGISADGAVAVGTSWMQLDPDRIDREAFLWSKEMGMVGLGVPEGYISSGAGEISDDGSVVAGLLCAEFWRATCVEGYTPFRWTKESGIVPLPELQFGAVSALTADGSVMVGAVPSAAFEWEAYRWTNENGIEVLGALEGGTQSTARGISPDGSVIVGRSNTRDEEGVLEEPRAFVWDELHGMRDLRTVLKDEFGLILPAREISSATDISADRQTIVGYSIDRVGGLLHRRPWVVVLDRPINSVFGDFSDNGLLDAEDLDLLGQELRSDRNVDRFDVNHDGAVNDSDLDLWVKDLAGTYFGDANLDGQFNSTDFVAVFRAGEYEDDIPRNSTWSTGDWNADADFDTSDLVAAFEDGGYEQGRPVGAALAVPEPTSALLVLGGLCLLLLRRERVH